MPRLLGKIPWIRRMLFKGSNLDMRPELRPDGIYQDTFDMRPVSIEGNTGALESIGGDVNVFTPEDDEIATAANYRCIGAFTASGKQVTFWASTNADDPGTPEPGIIKVEGVTMVKSTQIPYRITHPLQAAVINGCNGGIIFPADHLSDPLFWDIAAIEAAYNADTGEFFDPFFDINAVSVLPQFPLEVPRHIGNPEIGVGLPVGQYLYRLRFRTPNGDKTNFGPETPHISVEGVQSNVYWPDVLPPLTEYFQYAGGQTRGGTPDTTVASPYGIALRFQIDNPLGFTHVEICRRRFNDGQGLNGPGIDEVVGVLPIEPGWNGDLYFTDPADANFLELLPTLDAQQENVNFTAPRAVEHLDNRVGYGNFTLKERIVDLTFQDNAGVRIFPITTKVFTWRFGNPYNDGYADAVNNTYKKSYQHNDRNHFGLQLWDGASSKSPVVPIELNYTHPHRRDRKTGDSDTYSTDGIWAANNEVQGADRVSKTFDAIVQGSVGKLSCPTDYNGNPDDVNFVLNNGGGNNFVNVQTSQGSYNPWTPRNATDDDFVRYQVSPESMVKTDGGTFTDRSGAIFHPEYHSLGVAIHGPNDIDTEAPWWRVMTPMRSKSANRVIASGSSVYKLEEYNVAGTVGRRKDTNRICAYFPDIEAGIVPQNIVDDIANNPQNYTIRLTPFGFHREIYSYDDHPQTNNSNRIITAVDMVTYCSVQFDDGRVNAGEQPDTIGFQPTTSVPPNGENNFVGPSAWRSPSGTVDPASPGDENTTDYSPFFDPANTLQGAMDFHLTDFSSNTDGRGSYWDIETEENIYRPRGEEPTDSSFASGEVRHFHEPVYIVDIMRADAEVQDDGVTRWINTGDHVFRERTLGLFTLNAAGTGNAQVCDLELFNTRLHDAVPRQGVDNGDRFMYIRVPGQQDQRWMCADYSDTALANFAAIIADINANGFWLHPDDNLPVYGLYNYYEDTTGLHSRHMLRIGDYTQFPQPPLEARVVVKYDKREPIIAHGGPCTIAPITWAPIDRTYNGANGFFDTTYNNVFWTRAPLPYDGGVRNAAYRLPKNAGTNVPAMYHHITGIRQWVVYAEVVCRIQPRLITSDTFPRKHYVIRPTNVVDFGDGQGNGAGAANGFHGTYDQDYSGEGTWFAMGGFRFWVDPATEYNRDYMKEPLVTGVGVPIGAENPERNLCSSMIISERFNPVAEDNPGYRTFPSDNLYHCSSESGGIMLMHSLDQGGETHLYGWCWQGLFRIPYNRRPLSDASGATVAEVPIGSFWPDPGMERWLVRGEKGLPGAAWRMAVKANAPAGNSDIDTVIWPDRSGWYRMVGGSVIPIADGKRLSAFINKDNDGLLQVIPDFYGSSVTTYGSIYNKKHKEVWFQIDSIGSGEQPQSPRAPVMHVYNLATGEWTGQFHFNYDCYGEKEGQIMGYRELEGWELDKGFEMPDESAIVSTATIQFFPDIPSMKEAMRAKVVGRDRSVVDFDTDDKPDQVEVFDARMNLLCRMNEATDGALWVKWYDGWELWIDRVLAAVDATRPLPQSRGFFLKITYSTNFARRVLVASEMQIKNLR